MSREVLLIEDHRDIAEMVSDHLETEGFVIDYADNGLLGFRLGSVNAYDAIILDLMLPGIDGLDLCQKLREDKKITAPILMLTARDTLEDKLSGFNAGADDYLIKPFDLEELTARLNALIRRGPIKSGTTTLVVGDLVLCNETQIVTRQGKELMLTPIGKKILAVLMSESPNVVSRKQLEKAIWGDMPPDSDALRSHLYNLRKVIDKPFDSPLVHTVQSAGFRLSFGNEV